MVDYCAIQFSKQQIVADIDRQLRIRQVTNH
jgi:hypothetical protein